MLGFQMLSTKMNKGREKKRWAIALGWAISVVIALGLVLVHSGGAVLAATLDTESNVPIEILENSGEQGLDNQEQSDLDNLQAQACPGCPFTGNSLCGQCCLIVNGKSVPGQCLGLPGSRTCRQCEPPSLAETNDCLINSF